MVKSVFLTQQHTPKTAQTKTQRISIVMAYGSQLYGCGNLAKKNSFLPRPKQQQHHISSSVMCLGRATSFARNIKARPRNAIAAAAAAVAPAAMKLCRNAPLTARKKIQNDDRPTDESTRNKKKAKETHREILSESVWLYTLDRKNAAAASLRQQTNVFRHPHPPLRLPSSSIAPSTPTLPNLHSRCFLVRGRRALRTETARLTINVDRANKRSRSDEKTFRRD